MRTVVQKGINLLGCLFALLLQLFLLFIF